jgi:hypothetical protein
MLMDEILCLRENAPAVALALRGTRDRMVVHAQFMHDE